MQIEPHRKRRVYPYYAKAIKDCNIDNLMHSGSLCNGDRRLYWKVQQYARDS